jgi:mono/diheme cytochrome c family protein
MLVLSSSVWHLSHAKGEESPVNPSTAASLFRRYCQDCHGANGAGRAGVVEIPNFTSRASQEKREDADLLVSILDGKGTGMPAFQDRLSEAQVRGLVAHIRAFAPAPATGKAGSSPSARVPGGGFAAQFRPLQKEFEELQRQVQEEDSPRQSQSKPAPRTDKGSSGREANGAKGKRTGVESSTHNRTSSSVAGHRRASAEDRQEAQEPVELAARVHALFAAKCVQCHGANLPEPKGKFGYILDLERVRGNPKLVVPSRPDESKLWVFIRDNEMPPEGATVAPLTSEEKGQVRDWIAAGAPIALTYLDDAEDDPPVLTLVSSPPPTSARPFLRRLLGWLGRFHIPAIHLPIALFLAAAAGELCRLWYRIRDPWPPVRFCVLLGAAGSVLAAGLGWLHADFGGYGAGSPEVLSLHRWFGTLGSCAAAVAAVAAEIDSRRGRRSPFFMLMLFAAALLIGAAGHFGGSLVHGEDFFSW